MIVYHKPNEFSRMEIYPDALRDEDVAFCGSIVVLNDNRIFRNGKEITVNELLQEAHGLIGACRVLLENKVDS